MEEQKKIERDLMSQEEFERYIATRTAILNLGTYAAVGKHRSVRRAMRRGLVAFDGTLLPKRPFHNRANTCERENKHSRYTNELKKQIYGQYKQYRGRAAE